MTVTLTFGPASCRMTASTSLPDNPGKILQLITAAASCGSALFACPASTRVATHVVRRLALWEGERDRRAAAGKSGGTAATARMSIAVWPVSVAAVRSRKHAHPLGDVQRELVLADSREGRGEDVDRVLGAHKGTVATRVADFQPIVGVDLFARLQFENRQDVRSLVMTAPASVLKASSASMSARCSFRSH